MDNFSQDKPSTGTTPLLRMRGVIQQHKIKVVVVIAILAAFLITTSKLLQRHPPANTLHAGMHVSTMCVKNENVYLKQELSGRVVAYQVAEIRPQVGGIITDVMFVEGGEVQRGQQLYQIDDAHYRAILASASANLAKAEANAKSVNARAARYAKLIKIDAISKQEFDDITAQAAQAHADIEIAKAALKTAQINLDYTKVYAPIKGRIGKSNVTRGALVVANQPIAIASITQLDPIYVDLTESLEETYRTRSFLKTSNDIKIELELNVARNMDNTIYKYAGKLQFTDVTVDKTTGSVLLRTIFPNPEYVLLPGTFVRGLLSFKVENAILIPQSATIRGKDGVFSVWVVKNQIVKIQEIKVVQAIKDAWLVSAGVVPGDIIVTEGYQRLVPGMTVISTETKQTDCITTNNVSGDKKEYVDHKTTGGVKPSHGKIAMIEVT